MQLSPRPTRIPLTCSCGARLSVIPRLQGTEVKCPRCQESLLVPGEAGIQVLDDVPAVQMTLEVPILGGLGSGVLENSVGNAELTEAASESVQEPIRGIGESSFRQIRIIPEAERVLFTDRSDSVIESDAVIGSPPSQFQKPHAFGESLHSIEFIPNYAGRLHFAHLPIVSGYVPLPM